MEDTAPEEAAVSQHHGVPILSNRHPADEQFHTDRVRTTLQVAADGTLHNTPMLPKDTAIRYFQSEPNAPLIRTEIERHTGNESHHLYEDGQHPMDDTIDTADDRPYSSGVPFHNAQEAARIVAQQTERRLREQRHLLERQRQPQHDVPTPSLPKAGYGASRQNPILFSPRPHHSELGQQIKKLAGASRAARSALAKGIFPASQPSNRSGGSTTGSRRKKPVDLVGDAFRTQQQQKALARRRALARKSGAEYERNLARQKAAKRTEQLDSDKAAKRERQNVKHRQREEELEQRRTARKEKVRAENNKSPLVCLCAELARS